MGSEIDHYGPEAPYIQIAARVRAMITSGELAPGDRIPSETDLTGTFGVARSTARRAVALLRDEGVIFTVRGRGSYVVRPDG